MLRISSLSAEFNKLEFVLFDLLFQTLGVPHLLLQSRDEFHFALDLNVEALNSLVAGLDNVLAVLDFLFTFQNHLLVMRNSGILVAVVLLAVASGVVELGEHLLDEVVTVNACKHLLRLAGVGHELRDGGLRWRSLCDSSSGIRGRRFFSSTFLLCLRLFLLLLFRISRTGFNALGSRRADFGRHGRFGLLGAFRFLRSLRRAGRVSRSPYNRVFTFFGGCSALSTVQNHLVRSISVLLSGLELASQAGDLRLMPFLRVQHLLQLITSLLGNLQLALVRLGPRLDIALRDPEAINDLLR